MKEKSIQKDHGKDLFQVLVFLIALFGVLWYLQI